MKNFPARQWLERSGLFGINSNKNKRKISNRSRRNTRSLTAVEMLEDRICLTAVAGDDAYIVVQNTDFMTTDTTGPLGGNDDSVLLNDTDASQPTVTVAATAGSVNLSIVDGTFTYSPNNPNFIGADSFEYQVIEAPTTQVLMNNTNAWNYLHPTDGVDPNTSDPDSDFHSTWYTQGTVVDDYDGPLFTIGATLTGNGVLGYGNIAGATPTSPEVDLGTPALGLRRSAYFTSTFDLTGVNISKIQSISTTILADDGAIIYVNGTEVGRINMGGGADTYELTASNATDTEDVAITTALNLGAANLQADANNVIAISLHNASTNSSDLGLRMDDLSVIISLSSDTATVNLDVQDDGISVPVIADNAYTVDQDTSIDTIIEVANDGLLVNDNLFDGVGVAYDALVAVAVDQSGITAAEGILIVNTNVADANVGNFTFVPNSNFHGTVSFTYTVEDKEGVSLPATVTITVNEVNDLPVAVSPVGNYSTNENTLLTVSNTPFDSRIAAGATWTYDDSGFDFISQASGANQGTALDWRSGAFISADPAGDSSLPAWETGAAELGYGNSPVTEIDYGPDPNNVNNDASNKFTTYYFRNSFALTAGEASSITHLLLGLQRDDGAAVYLNGERIVVDNLTSSSPANDTFAATTIGGDDETTFFQYTIPIASLSTPLVAGVNIIAVEVHQASLNSSDVSFDLELKTSADYGAALTGNVLANSTDLENQSLFVLQNTLDDVDQGTLILNDDGTFSYTPNLNFQGIDTFSFKITDNPDLSLIPSDPEYRESTGFVTVTINVGDNSTVAPTAVGDSYQSYEDQPLIINAASGNGLLSNDNIVPENGSVIPVVMQQPPASEGAVVLDDTLGSFTFTPAANFNGTTSFTYKNTNSTGDSLIVTVSILVVAVPDLATANNILSGTYSTTENEPADAIDTVIDVLPSILNNDTAAGTGTSEDDISNVIATLDTPPVGGTLLLSADGHFTYTPTLGFHGQDSFTYRASIEFPLIERGGNNTEPFLSDRRQLWKYLDDGTNQGLPGEGSSWFGDPAFNDSTWLPGLGEIGYGETNHRTTVGFIDTDPVAADDQVNATTYFRTTFSAYEISNITGLTLGILYDDAAAVYLNGTEIFRSQNLASNATYTQFATAGTPDENAFFDIDITAFLGALQEGENLIAVEIHQNSNSSSDISLDLDLRAAYSSSPATVIIDVANNHQPIPITPDSYTVFRNITLNTLVDGQPSVFANDGIFNESFTSALVVDNTSINGTLTYDPLTGHFTFEPALDFIGTVDFTYELTDPDFITSPVTVTINVIDGDDPPIGVDDPEAGQEAAYQVIAGQVLNVSIQAGVEILSPGSNWDYDDTNTDWPTEIATNGTPGAPNWLESNFDPSDPFADGTGAGNNSDFWTGNDTASFGFGDPVTTEVTDTSPNIPTYYFRSSFEVGLGQPLEDKDEISELLLNLAYDDGAVVYINGNLVLNVNVPDGFDHNTFAGPVSIGDGTSTPFVVKFADLSGGNPLINGTNIIAVEVHQGSAGSSDIFFDLGISTIIADNRVLANDTDIDTPHHLLTATLVTPPANHDDQGGSSPFVLNSDGSFTYFSNGTTGIDTFTYTVSDETSTSAPVTVSISVAESLQVTSTTPADEAVESSPPSIISVNFTTNVLNTSVAASDLTIDTLPATAINIISPTEIEFTLPVGLSVGIHQVDIAAGALIGSLGQLSVAYSGNFTITELPTIENLPVVNVNQISAVLRANVEDIGFDPPQVLIYWGDEDGGTNPGSWDSVIDFGLNDVGSVAQQILGLTAATDYFYRAAAINNSGTDWAAVTATFSTITGTVDPRINEFLADNETVLQDFEGGFEDWIEIHNPGIDPLDISGWYLTDDAGDLTQWAFPATTVLAPNEYRIVFASNKFGLNTGSELHTNFKLGKGGEYLALVRPDGTTIVQEFSPAFPAQTGDISYGLKVEDLTPDFFDPPTPGSPNSAGEVVISELMYHPTNGTENEEWIEITNVGGLPVDLTGWQFTDGIDFTFGTVTLNPGSSLIIAADLTEFQTNYPAVTAVVGGWTGALSNSGEKVELQDSLGQTIDIVEYADQGDWGLRRAGPLDQGHTGWQWLADHDGGGKTLELINLQISNDYGQNWASSTPDGGTPAAVNSAFAVNIATMILDVSHSPAIPQPNVPVNITARLLDESNLGNVATVFYRESTSTPGAFIQAFMFDDGLNGDGAAGDGVFGATLPGMPDGTVVEFYLQATDGQANSRTWPAPTDDMGTQGANLLYQVDGSVDSVNQPYFRIILSEPERIEFENADRDSDAQFNVTFISSNGVESEVRYNAAVRIRGASSRSADPPNFRLNLPSDNAWNGVDALNLNTQYVHSQIAGSAVFRTAGVPAADYVAVQVRVNAQQLANSGLPQFGSYVYLEAENSDFVDHHFSQDSNGNLYKGQRPNSDLSYLGPDPLAYQTSYAKQTNSAVDDWSDLINLTDVLNNTPDESYIAALETTINIDQWLEYFAINVLLANNETTLGTGVGDDYLMYRGEIDQRFVLLPRDLDTILGEGDNPGSFDDDIFQATNTTAIARFLNHPDITSRYYSTLIQLVNTTFSPAVLDPMLDNALGGFVPQGTIDNMKAFAVARNAFVIAQIPTTFTAFSTLPIVDGFPTTTVNSTGQINGTADAARTRRVSVNGQDVNWSSKDGTWSLGDDVVTILPTGQTWEYLDNASDQDGTLTLGIPDRNPSDTTWFASPSYDLSNGPANAWESGLAILGYGDPEIVTTVDFVDIDLGTSGVQKNATTYFRHTFNIADPSIYSSVTLRLMRDDGAAVYINGLEVGRDNLNPNDVFSDYANGAVGSSAEENSFIEFSVNTSDLVVGDNLIAVEIHQANPTSSDIRMEVEIIATVPGAGSSIALQPGINRILVQTFDETDTEFDRTFVDVLYDDGSTSPKSGIINVNDTWTVADGPFLVTGDITVQNGATLTIEAGATVYFQTGTGITVSGTGRIEAIGTEHERIRFTRVPGAPGRWDGLRFTSSASDNQLAYLDMEYGDAQGESIRVTTSTLVVDNARFENITETIIEMSHPKIIISNTYFADPGVEYIHGGNTTGTEYIIIDGNVFAFSNGNDDVLDITFANRETGIPLQILNNIFLGGGDDGLDLDSTDTHIEGNIFFDFKDRTTRATTSNAIATGENDAANPTEITVVRNIFFDNDHHILVKDNATLTAENNVFIGADLAAIQLNEVGGTANLAPGFGAFLDGNIFLDNAQLFKNLVDDGSFKTTLVMNNSRVPNEIIDFDGTPIPSTSPTLGTGNITDDPRFIMPTGGSIADLREAFKLLLGSPAIATGPNGLDMGYDVPAGASISGEPVPNTASGDATLTIGGPGITAYRYQINGGAFTAETPINTPIQLNGLADGTYTIGVIGKNSAHVWQAEADATLSQTWTVNSSLELIQINEVLASNLSAVDHEGTFPDVIELYNAGAAAVDLLGMSLSDDTINPTQFTFDTTTIVNPGEYLLLYANEADGTSGIHVGFSLSSAGEGVFLYDSGLSLLDSVEFGLQVSDLSIGRDTQDQWQLNQPSLGALNIAQTTAEPSSLKINEWLASRNTDFSDDYIELYNADTLPVSLAGLFLTDDPVGRPNKHEIAALSFIGAQDWALFQADDDESKGPSHVNFKLSGLREMIGLFDSSQTVIDQLIYTSQVPDISQGRDGDGGDLFVSFDPPNLGLTNSTVGHPHQDLLDSLRITEILFDPKGGDEHEFIELMNVGASTINLNNVEFRQAIDFDFGNIDLAAGEKIVVVRDIVAFQSRFGTGLNIAGQYTGGLDNTGEQIVLGLPDPFSSSILDFTYDGTWFGDVAGRSYKIIDPNADPSTWGLQASWMISNYENGSPTRDDLSIFSDDIVINEVLAHSNGGVEDWIELHNTSGGSINIGTWWLSDDPAGRLKYQIPFGTTIAAGGFLILDQVNDFGGAFALSELGDEVVLTSVYSDGQIAGYQREESFGASFDGVTFGRHLISTGESRFVSMVSSTIDNPNSLPLVGPLVINEIHYNPITGNEFIEILNISGSTVELFDPLGNSNPDSRWLISGGIDFEFPVGASVAAGSLLILIPDSVAETTFRIDNNIPLSVPIFQWDDVNFSLSNGGERITLSQPGVPEGPGAPIPGLVPQIVVDSIRYDDVAPWPTEPDGNGPSLARIDANLFGDDPANWQASIVLGPTAGYDNATGDNIDPTIVTSSQSGTGPYTVSYEFSEQVDVTGSDLALENTTLTQNVPHDLFSYDPSTRIATWTFNTLTDGDYTATLNAAAVNDPAGNVLNAAGNDVVNFTIGTVSLPGDFNDDKTVDAIDLGILLQNYGLASGAVLSQGDANGDGKVSLADLLIVKKNFGSSISSSPAPSAAAASLVTTIDSSPQPAEQSSQMSSSLNRKVTISISAVDQIHQVDEKPALQVRSTREARVQATDHLITSNNITSNNDDLQPTARRVRAIRARRGHHSHQRSMEVEKF